MTFLFTDIEGSTRLERAVGTTAWATVVAAHEERLRDAIRSHGGSIVKTEGDAVFGAFADPASALIAIAAAQRSLAEGGWADGIDVRIRGLHTGEGRLRDRRTADDPDDYVGNRRELRGPDRSRGERRPGAPVAGVGGSRGLGPGQDRG